MRRRFGLELQSYRDQKHLEDVTAKMENDQIGPQLFREFMDLITPGSRVIMGGFQPPQGLDFVYLMDEGICLKQIKEKVKNSLYLQYNEILLIFQGRNSPGSTLDK